MYLSEDPSIINKNGYDDCYKSDILTMRINTSAIAYNFYV